VGSFGSAGGSTPVPIASVAKVMTAYLTLLKYPLGPGQAGFTMTVTVADVAEEQQRAALAESILPVATGERLTEREALEALLVPSANNIAAMLAAHDAGNSAAFVDLMNATARRLGMGATTYTDPSGFEDSTVSTAGDQLKLARAAMREPVLAAIVDERSVELPLAGLVANFDGLVGRDGYVGVKTGSDRAAGGCLVFDKRIEVAGRHLDVLGVVLGQRGGSIIDAALSAAERLGDSAAASVHLQTVLPAATTVLGARSPDGGRTAAVTSARLADLGWGGLSIPLQVMVRPVSRSVRAGQVLGVIRVASAPTIATDVVAAHGLGEPGLGYRLAHIF
jgi:D-alanyl-D-alanine carboxypeptidase (penicillin-binding protein 5/6)